MMYHIRIVITLVLVAQTTLTTAFSTTPQACTKKIAPHHRHTIKEESPSYDKASSWSLTSTSASLTSTSLNTFMSGDEMINSSILLCDDVESWRQYVPLVVSVGVILDILLGSPIANLALAPMKRAAEQENDGNDKMTRKGFVKNPKERVDSDGVAQAALDKARNSMELRRFLEENKTDLQRAAEARDVFDKEAEKFDQRIIKKDKNRL